MILIKTFKKDKNIIIWLSKIFIFWRTSLILFTWLGIKILSFKESFPYVNELLLFKPFNSQVFWPWANFDGVHYIRIAESGYIARYVQAFFPLYPLVIRYSTFLFGNFLLSGLLVSNLFFLLSLYFFYKLIKLDYNTRIVKSSLLFLVLFPTSFFFGAFYTESLFLFLELTAFYAARNKKWWLAGIIGFLASLTKLIGVLLVPALLWEIYKNKNHKENFWSIENIKNLFFIFLPGLGLMLYMFYLAKNYSDPLYFIHAQSEWGASRSVDKLILLYQVFYRYVKMMLTFNLDKFFYFTVILEFLSGLIFLILLIWAYIKKVRISYLLFAVSAYLLPTLTGTFSSMPRYVLLLFPCFIVLGMIKNLWLKRFLYLFSFILLTISTMLFIRGYWVA